MMEIAIDPALYGQIPIRKSVRKYRSEPLGAEALAAVQARLAAVPALEAGDGHRVELRLLTPAQVGGVFAVKAPHFLAAYAGEDARSLMGVGFALQQMELWLNAQGFGCCYSGMGKAAKGARSLDGLECRMLLGFGQPAEPAHRGDVSEFDRKPLDEIASPGVPRELAEAVRLAPSAMNAQNWYLDGDEERVHLYRSAKGGIAGVFAKGLGQIDLGIALCHLATAAGATGRSCRLSFDPPAALPDGLFFVCTATL